MCRARLDGVTTLHKRSKAFMRVSVLVRVSFLCFFAAQHLLMSLCEQMLRSSSSIERSCTEAQAPASRLHSSFKMEKINMEKIETCKQAAQTQYTTSASNAVLQIKYHNTHTHTHTHMHTHQEICTRYNSSNEGLGGFPA